MVVNNTPRPVDSDASSMIERQRIRDVAGRMVGLALMKIFELVGGEIYHIPPGMYEFEISCTKKVDDREHLSSRVASMPPLLKLDGGL